MPYKKQAKGNRLKGRGLGHGKRGTHVLVEVGRGKARDSACAGKKWGAGKRGTARVLEEIGRGKARDSACAGRNGARDSAGKPAGQRGTAHVPIKMGRGNVTPFGVLNI